MNEIDLHAILGISDVVIEKTEMNSNDEFLIYVKSTKEGANCHQQFPPTENHDKNSSNITKT